MATTSIPNPNENSEPEDINDDEEDDDDDEEDEYDDDELDEDFDLDYSGAEAGKQRAAAVLRRLESEPVLIRVHEVVIRGNSKTRTHLIESEVGDVIARAGTVQELLRASAVAFERLRRLDAFDGVSMTLEAGPPELPGTANVVVEVFEAKRPGSADFGVFVNPETRSFSVESSVKFKNLFGFADLWDASGAFGLDQTIDLSAGVSLPRFKAIPTPLGARISLLSQDWLKSSSFQEHMMGVSFGLLSTTHHDLVYNIGWRRLIDQSHASSKSIRSQLGDSLLSSVKYTCKIDHRDSHLRPTRGYAFLSSSQVGGLAPESNSRFIRQEFDLRGALPLGILNAALNVGAAAGLIVPWGRGSTESASSLPEKFFLGGNSCLVCRLGGPSQLMGFKRRGLDPTELRRSSSGDPAKDGPTASSGEEILGGNLAVTAFADLSFDLPVKPLKDLGIHGHAFVSAGNLTNLTGSDLKNFPFHEFLQKFRSCAGFGVILPTKLFRMEINYCHVLNQFENDRGKTGIQFNFSSP